MERRFSIIGAGPGAAALLTGEAQEALQSADAVFATARLAEGFAPLRGDIAVCPFGELAARAAASDAAHTAVLVSGDVGFWSAAPRLREQLAPFGETALLCGLSSLQYFCARLGARYDDACVRSLHGRGGSLLGAVSYHRKVFALTGGEQTAQAVCRELTAAGLGGVCVSLGENLGGADERILRGTAASLADEPCAGLAVLFIEHDEAVDAREPVRDAMLTRGDVPMTKEEVRWVSLAKLAVRPHDTVWDVGAGTGAVTLELARRASDGLVYAVERKPEAVSLLARNRAALGGYNVKLVEGLAPDALADLPAPDAVFVGGSGGQLRAILACAKQKNPAVRVVVNAIALETVHEAQEALRALGFAETECVQLSAARGRAVGRYTMMTAGNPVFILSGGGHGA